MSAQHSGCIGKALHKLRAAKQLLGVLHVSLEARRQQSLLLRILVARSWAIKPPRALRCLVPVFPNDISRKLHGWRCRGPSDAPRRCRRRPWLSTHCPVRLLPAQAPVASVRCGVGRIVDPESVFILKRITAGMDIPVVGAAVGALGDSPTVVELSIHPCSSVLREFPDSKGAAGRPHRGTQQEFR